MKIGRTTGLTVGKYSHIESHVCVSLEPNNLDQTPAIRDTDEKVIVRDPSWGSQISFSSPGDSGAWVIDDDGYLAGLIWGMNGIGACYYTPITDVVANIEKQNGFKVEFET